MATESSISLATAAAVLMLLPPAMLLPFMRSSIDNLVFEQSRLISSVPVIYEESWVLYAVGFLLCAFLLPLLRALVVVVVLGSLRWGPRLPAVGRLFRWSEELRVWSMTEVVVLAAVITYFRTAAPGEVDILVGAWCYLAAAIFAFVSEHSLDRRAIWDSVLPDASLPNPPGTPSCGVCEMTVPSGRPGDTCPRCAAKLGREVSRSYLPALLATAVAAPLVVPAFSFAVIVNQRLTGVTELSVLGTVQLMADRGLWHFGAVLLLTGVVLPIVELVGISWLLARVRFPRPRGLVGQTRAYRLLRSLVRWPLTIPFIVALSSPIIAFPGVDEIRAGPGAAPYFLMVVLLVMAVDRFESRLLWSAAGVRR